MSRRSLSLLAVLMGLAALPVAATPYDPPQNPRVIVSATLNSTLHFIDAVTLAEHQYPLPSKGLGPVRLWVADVDGRPYLFAANHGAAVGSLGIFDLSGDTVLELPASPFPARPGPVGVVAGTADLGTRTVPMAFVTNTWFALGGCGMPNGSATGYDLSMLNDLGIAVEAGTVQLDAPIPWGVSMDGDDRAYVSSNCADDVTAIELLDGPTVTMSKGASRPAGDGADGTIFDTGTMINFTANIAGSSVTAHAEDGATTVPIPGARPIDINLGGPWAITSNGGDDTVSLIDRAAVAACIAAAETTCDAEVARIATGVPGGAPEGVAYDPTTERIFVVNKPIGGPSLTVIQVADPLENSAPIATLPLNALGAEFDQVPALIAFDVVVQQRG